MNNGVEFFAPLEQEKVMANKRGRPRKDAEREAPKRTERGQSKHPGVQIIKRETSAGVRYFARWDDPLRTRKVPVVDKQTREPLFDKRTGRPRMELKRERIEENLDQHGLTSDSARELWAKTRAKNLREERARIAAGEAIVRHTTVKSALEAYYESKGSELQPATLTAYQQGTKPFEAWCAAQSVLYIESLTPALLAQFREWFVGQPAYVPLTGRGVGKGTRKAGKRRKSPAQERKCLNSLRVVLAQLRREGKLPAFDSDAIVDSLKFPKAERAKRKFLDTAQIRALLEACQRHDSDGHDSIAPFTAACLLTGMRFNELAELTWDEVDTNTGSIDLEAGRTKTATERTVYLDKLPTLWEWLKRGKLAAGGKGRVFPHLTFAIARMARARLIGDEEGHYNAPAFTWHRLRATCGTYSVCSSLYGRGSEHETARQLGHSIQVAQAHYTGRGRDGQPNAETLEDAMRCREAFATCFKVTNDRRVQTAV